MPAADAYSVRGAPRKLTRAELIASRTVISLGANALADAWKERKASAAGAWLFPAEHAARDTNRASGIDLSI